MRISFPIDRKQFGVQIDYKLLFVVIQIDDLHKGK